LSSLLPFTERAHTYAKLPISCVSSFLAIFDYLSHLTHGLLESINDCLLLFHTIVSVYDASVQRVVLIEREVTLLTIGKKEFCLCLIFLFIVIVLNTKAFLLVSFVSAFLLHNSFQVLGLRLFLNL